MTLQKAGWQRGWRKLYEEVVNLLKSEFIPIWGNFGFQTKVIEEPNGITAALLLNGKAVNSLQVRLREAGEGDGYCIDFIERENDLKFSLKKAI